MLVGYTFFDQSSIGIEKLFSGEARDCEHNVRSRTGGGNNENQQLILSLPIGELTRRLDPSRLTAFAPQDEAG